MSTISYISSFEIATMWDE